MSDYGKASVSTLPTNSFYATSTDLGGTSGSIPIIGWLYHYCYIPISDVLIKVPSAKCLSQITQAQCPLPRGTEHRSSGVSAGANTAAS